jgi:hypothetical protein
MPSFLAIPRTSVRSARYLDKTSAEARRSSVRYYIVTDVEEAGDRIAFRHQENAVAFVLAAKDEDLRIIQDYGSIADVEFEDDRQLIARRDAYNDKQVLLRRAHINGDVSKVDEAWALYPNHPPITLV